MSKGCRTTARSMEQVKARSAKERYVKQFGMRLCRRHGISEPCGVAALDGSPYCRFHLDERNEYEAWWNKTIRPRLQRHPVNLRDMWLEGIDFRGLKLRGAIFNRSQLWGAVFEECDLDNASFFRANLSESSWRKCSIRAASFYEANLTHAVLDSMDEWEGARLTRCNLSASIIANSWVRRANFSKANLASWRISSTYFDECVFENVRADHSKMVFSGFRRCVFLNMVLNDARIDCIDLSDAGSLKQLAVQDASITSPVFYADESKDLQAALSRKGAAISSAITAHAIPTERKEAIMTLRALVAASVSGSKVSDLIEQDRLAIREAQARLRKAFSLRRVLDSRPVQWALGSESNAQAVGSTVGLVVGGLASTSIGGPLSALMPMAGLLVGGVACMMAGSETEVTERSTAATLLGD